MTELPDQRIGRALLRLFPAAAPDSPLSIRFERDGAARAEGSYTLEIADGRRPEVRITSRDAAGAFYALLALKELSRNGRPSPQRLEDGPKFRWRGVVEGFYGQPWTWEQRRRFVGWMAERRFNVFVLAPKDEDSLRRYWRRPLDQSELRELGRLVEEAREGFVDVAWTLSPGLDARFGSQEDVEAAAAKYRQVIALGVRRLALAFDDTTVDAGQISFANRVLQAVLASHPDVEFHFVPAVYWGEGAQSRYLGQVAERLDPRFSISWTGGQIISRTITTEEGRRFRERMRHPLVLVDNYPVQDALVDGGRLFLGPLRGRDAGLAESQDGWLANASPLPEASKLALHTVSDFAWNPGRYDPWRSWEGAIRSLGGDAGVRWLGLLARESASSWVGGPASGSLREAVQAYWAGNDRGEFRRRLEELQGLPEGLKAGLKANPELHRELRMWASKLAGQARAALAGLDALEREGERPLAAADPALSRLRILRRESESNPAVVAEFEMERFLNRVEASLRGGSPADPSPLTDRIQAFAALGPDAGEERRRQAAGRVREGLLRVEAAPEALEAALGERARAARELVPWIDALSLSARRARLHLEAKGRRRRALLRPPLAVEEALWRWRIRLRFIPIAPTYLLLESFLRESESSWLRPPAEVPGRPWWMRLGLWAQRTLQSDSFPARLHGGLEAYRATGDSRRLAEAFQEMVRLPAELRSMGEDLPVEVGPWLHKLEQHGRLGLKALELQQRERSGRPIASGEMVDWKELRLRAASTNGLELPMELKHLLDATARWLRLPPGRRPAALDLTLPANPAHIL